MAAVVRHMVSKKKRRFMENGFDLDLSYITNRVIAMAYPGESWEGFFRNPLSEVMRFLKTYHERHFKVINLCSERDYDPTKLGGNVERIPLEDHQIAPLNAMLKYCRTVDDWLSQDENNVLVTHCKAGKGRSGLMICAYLLYISYCPDSPTALQFYAEKRTTNGKGVTIPSQRRYVEYFHDYLINGPRQEVEMQLAQISFTSNVVSTKEVNVVISTHQGNDSWRLTKLISTKEELSQEEGSKVSCSKSGNTMVLGFTSLWISGDMKFEFQSSEARLFYIWFNTAYVEGTEFSLWNKQDLDKPSKSMESICQFKKMSSTRTTTERHMWEKTQTHTNILAHEISLVLCTRYNVTAIQLLCRDVGIMYILSVLTLLSVDRVTQLSKLCWNPKLFDTKRDRPGCSEIKACIIISYVTENFISIIFIFSCTHSS
ncbi:hypothetical protein Mapa_006622 [Marchantia paleacea]|nr:hypothetical protein Mapa_006622 [Marchantia paleacea]